MTTKKFANYLKKQCKSIGNVSFEPIFNEYIVERNEKRVGVLNEDKFYLISTDNLKKLLPNSVEENPFNWAYYKLIHIENTDDVKVLKELVIATYNDLYLQKEFVCDISALIEANRRYSDIVVRIYNLHITFLCFCYEKELLKCKPLDKNERIIRMYFTNNDLTEKGVKMFNDLYFMWLEYTDKGDDETIERINNVKMLEKYYVKVLKEIGLTG